MYGLKNVIEFLFQTLKCFFLDPLSKTLTYKIVYDIFKFFNLYHDNNVIGINSYFVY